ncbi:2-hydroxyacyl-CoA dehydratase family protein [Methanocaldococcus sp.]|uniref:2-hydroxyacyl-CoA dehydratase family protein n=1 Tax=Methanocaldococcus sp. TaxID=2152917 RepID=UPI002630F5C6|nr:2-hydroxyacyl-CoA dehydratase family protein [Methanocaldococcus sp.]MCQ6253775.1 2-hydroxyacyl-CoA dehydratase family protein [Methanocaldococcus sp.]
MKIGITAIIPPEIIYSAGHTSIDLNNLVPQSKIYPKNKLCAWTATWRELILKDEIKIDKLIVVAGGDCQNSLVDAEKIELKKKIPTYYFFYQFGDKKHFKNEIKKLIDFLGGNIDKTTLREVYQIKKLAKKVDELCYKDKINGKDTFYITISASDLKGDLNAYKKEIYNILNKDENIEYSHRIALIGIPPIFSDFYEYLNEINVHCVYNELAYEFVRMGGDSIKNIVNSYSTYSFANHITKRIKIIKKELKRRKVDGVIHYTQMNCHHKLEDEILREFIDYPMLTIEGDIPQKTPEQTKLRVEAFIELLG